MILSKNMQELVAHSSILRKIFEEGLVLSKELGEENVFDFSLGNPSVPTPERVNDTIVDTVRNENSLKVHGYMKNAGFDEVRTAVAEHLDREYGQSYRMDNVIMTSGAAGGLNCILRVLLNPDDEVVCFAPYFSEYGNYVGNFFGKTVVIPADFETFQPNVESLPDYVNERTRAVILNSPNNPSGVIYRAETLDRLNVLLREAEKKAGHPIFVICDEPYRELAYDGIEVPWMPDHIRNTIVCSSFSKTLSLPGERIGYLVVPSDIDEYETMQNALICANRTLGYINAPSLMQLVIAKCLDEKCDVAAYDRNRTLFYDSLTSYGFTCVKPEGAFYMLVKSPVEDENEFIAEAKKLGLLFVTARGWGAPGYVRIAYCVPYEKIERSLPRFRELAKRYFS